MKESNSITDRRQEWEQMPTEELEVMLHSELEKPVPDDDAVLLLLHILETREPDTPAALTPRETIAWQKYQTRVHRRTKQSRTPRRWIPAAASLVLVIGLLFSMIPQQAEAETLWEMLSRWKESVLQFLNPEEKFVAEEYVFHTDHPGLQQVYDAVTELGIDEPVVPMWIPEEYELSDLDEINTPKLKGINVNFSNGEKYLVYKADVYADSASREYYKDDSYSEVYEVEGMTYNVTKNKEWWIVVWSKENIECSIALDCQEETLRRILDSIYTMEEN